MTERNDKLSIKRNIKENCAGHIQVDSLLSIIKIDRTLLKDNWNFVA